MMMFVTFMCAGQQSEEWIEYFQELRDSVLEAFSGIIHGLREADKLPLLKPHVNSWLTFIQAVVEDPYSNISNVSKATKVTGSVVTVVTSVFLLSVQLLVNRVLCLCLSQ